VGKRSKQPEVKLGPSVEDAIAGRKMMYVDFDPMAAGLKNSKKRKGF
jgi:hypothetical protein